VSPVDPVRRALLRRCLDGALHAVDGRRAVAAALASLDLPAGVPVLAIGKAAPAMLAGAADALGDRVGPALCITRADAARAGDSGMSGARILHGDHPVPGARSLAAGEALMHFIDMAPDGRPLLCLLSGGSSALAEVLPPGVDLAGLKRANEWLLGSGLPIGAVNQVRAGLSCLKAGRLAQRLRGQRVMVLAISDVPGDDPAAIGSGPWTASAAAPWPDGLPAWLLALLRHAPPRPAPGDASLAAIDYRLVAHGMQALRAAGEVARAAGLPVTLHEAPFRGEVPAVAEALLATLLAGRPGLHGWSGESTIRLPARPGRGGRNSHLALTLACALAGRPDVEVLCAATDGSDGDGGAAGGWADGGVLARGAARGLDARTALARADSGAYLAATGDALVTGATGTNVMDLVLALAPGDRGV
jgi:glycerate 2-kinase